MFYCQKFTFTFDAIIKSQLKYFYRTSCLFRSTSDEPFSLEDADSVTVTITLDITQLGRIDLVNDTGISSYNVTITSSSQVFILRCQLQS